MARPRLGDSESQRLQMVITEDEVRAIDNWRFANRVPSRSEAIRRLVQIGLRMEREIPELLANSMHLDEGISAVIENARAKMSKVKVGDDTFETLIGIARSMLKDADRALLRQLEAKDHLFNLVNEVAPLVNAEKFADLGEALKIANEARAEVEAGETALKKILAEHDAKEGKK